MNINFKQAEKLKSREMKDEGWKMNDECWKMKDEGVGRWRMNVERWRIQVEGSFEDRQTDEQTDICQSVCGTT